MRILKQYAAGNMLLLAVVAASITEAAHAFLAAETASVQIADMRFYSVKALPAKTGGGLDLIAAGQIKKGRHNEGLVITFAVNGGKIKETKREVFGIGNGSTRARSLVCIRPPSTKKTVIVVNGKGGPENGEVGFIRSYLLDDGFELVDSIEVSDSNASYTHGYPLIRADLDGDKKDEIIYGGFAGHNDRDHADMRIFSIGSDGCLAPFKGIRCDRLNSLRLRINAVTAGDVNKDGKTEIAVAGRTVENDIEHAAFAVLSGRELIWKSLTGLGSGRYRYSTVTDIDADGQTEVILGGRVAMGGTYYALLDVWQAQGKDMQLISRYRFSGAGSTRLRIVEPMPGCPGDLIIGGRIETLQDGGLKWKGFLQRMTFESGVLMPSSKPVILDKDRETRVRTIDVLRNHLVAAGFTEDKSKAYTGFISIYPLSDGDR